MKTLMLCVMLLVTPAWASDDPAIRRDVEVTMRAMAAAAVAGDAEAYLVNVWEGDPLFLNEQKYFANDLRKKPAAEVLITLGEFEVGDGSIRGPITWAWTMPERKPRTVTFKGRFVQDGAAWKYAGETWDQSNAEGVEVLHDPGLEDLAARTAEAFVAIRRHVEEGFDLSDAPLATRTQQIKIYGSMKHLQASICLGYETPLGGWNEPGEPIKLLASNRTSPAELRRLLAHEYGHVATFELGPKANSMPWWALEGVAELAGEKYGTGRSDGVVRAWAKAGRLPPFADISDFDITPAKNHGFVYAMGHHMISFISERFARTGRNRWLSAMANGRSIDEASIEVFSIDFATLEREWKATLPAPEPPADKAEPTKDGDAEGS